MSDTPWPPPLPWPSSPLTDGVVVLSRLTFADSERVVVGCCDAETQRWLPLPSPYTDEDARAFIGTRDQAADQGVELTLGVRGADDGVLAGAIGVHLRGYRNEADIGYWTAPDRRRRGWTARATRLLARHALRTLPLRRVEIIAAVDNLASRGVAERSGAVFEGIRRQGMPTGDDAAAVYAFVRADFTETQP